VSIEGKLQVSCSNDKKFGFFCPPHEGMQEEQRFFERGEFLVWFIDSANWVLRLASVPFNQLTTRLIKC
jgi:hypothetical protein